MSITSQFKQKLKAKAHKLNPIVIIGNKGLTDNVSKEIDRGLTDHELIKIRINGGDREERQAIFNEICATAGAEAVQLIGNIGIIYRENPEEN
ncbi:MAG: ribosome assembly RNA-binding protein YhbY [Gammaproteobacteria bacterium]